MPAPRATPDTRSDHAPVVLGLCTAALLSLWLWREWPAWPALACAISGAAALWIARRSESVVNWPGRLTALAGLLDACLWFVVIRTLGTGLDPAVEPLARAALLPALAIGPMIVMRDRPAAWPYAAAQTAGLVLAGCWSLIELTRVPPAGGSVWWPALAGVLLGVAPLAWILIRPSARAAISLAAVGLVYVAYHGAPALSTVWAEKQLRDPAIYAASKATVEDLQDAYAVFAITPEVVDRVMVRVPGADWSRGGDFIEAYTITSGLAEGSDPRGRIFSVKSAEPHGDLLLSRDVTLTQIGTKAKPLTGQPLVLQARLSRAMSPAALEVRLLSVIGLGFGALIAWSFKTDGFAFRVGILLSMAVMSSLIMTEPGWSAMVMAALILLTVALYTWFRPAKPVDSIDLVYAVGFALLMLDLDRAW